jgi:hypothetical protein
MGIDGLKDHSDFNGDGANGCRGRRVFESEASMII